MCRRTVNTTAAAAAVDASSCHGAARQRANAHIAITMDAALLASIFVALIGLLAAIGFAPCPSLLWRRFLSGPLLLRIKAAPFKNPLAFAAFGRPVACLLAASLPVCGFGLRASLAVLACARFALSASSSVARLSCRHFYRHGGNAP